MQRGRTPMEQGQEQSVKKANSVKNEAWEWTKALLLAAALVIIIRWLICSPFVVEGPSMEPNFYTGEKMIVNKILYKFREPKRGEVLVFLAPDGRDYIKRVIALPGDKVRVEGDKVYVNDTQVEEAYLKEALDEAAKKGVPYNRLNNFAEQTVPENSLFAMGDNRSNSLDSRDSRVGFVPYDHIIGRADVIYWPLDKISLIH
ncbi:signal peptidase I [Paenibacillus validus]|uniref:Signal peptidase I n=2 Tax=Paenibacillus TaxID=44249 RepID=A0A7X2ZAB4_9BACL|nr:signal peptidase I [Paenibacillus validus]